MRMTQLSTEHQTSSNKLPKPTKEHLQNELHFHLAEKVLVKLREKEHISQEDRLKNGNRLQVWNKRRSEHVKVLKVCMIN